MDRIARATTMRAMLAYPLPRMMAGAALVVALVGGGVVVALEGARLQAEPWILLAPLLVGFGLFKGSLATNALLTLRRDHEAGERLAAHHGSVRALRAWIAYKYVAMVIAFLGAGVCLALG